MKVLVAHGRYRSAAPSGENNVVDQERALLVEAGHRVTTFERHSDDITRWPVRRKAALPVRSVWDPDVRRRLAAVLEHDRPDVVHVHNTFPLLSPSVLSACADAGVPVVATLHNYRLVCASGNLFRDEQPCHACVGRGVAPGLLHGCYRGSRAATTPLVLGTAVNRSRWRELVSAYIFISAAQRELMAPLGLPPDRMFVKHNFVPDRAIASPARDHTVAYVGRLDAAKGVPLLMRAWDTFRRRHPHSALRLLVAGGGELEAEVRAWADAHPSVEVLGMVGREEAASVIAGSLAVLVPSLWEEPFGLVAVEAMAAGVAPVAPASGAFPELIEHGVDGVLFDHGSPHALADAIGEVDRWPERHIELGARGRRTYEQRFTPAAGLARLLEIYRFAASQPVPAP